MCQLLNFALQNAFFLALLAITADASADYLYCPCLFKTICTDINGDEMEECPADHHNGSCPVNHDLYGNNSAHKYFKDEGTNIWMEEVDVESAQKGFHCMLFLAYQTTYDQTTKKMLGTFKSRYIRKVMGVIPFNFYGEPHADPCHNDCENDRMCERPFSYPEFFTVNPYDADSLKTEKVQLIEHVYRHCCPTKAVWEEFNRTGRMIHPENGTFTDEYREEFNKCNSPEFIYWGRSVTDEAIKSGRFSILQRSSFWIPVLIVIFTMMFAFVTIKLCCLRIALKRKEHLDRTLMEMPSDRPEFEEKPTKLLGQGGGGRVYEGKFGGTDVAVKMIDRFRDSRVAKSLRNECIIQHAFNHPYILHIHYPSIGNIPLVGSADRIDQIVVDKYGWDIKKRNLSDLLREIHNKGRSDKLSDAPEWSQKYVNGVAWDVVRSLVKGVETLHTAWGCDDKTGYGKYIKSVVHRDIKLKNIGVKKDSDGAFFSVIADFGLSAVCLKDSGRERVKFFKSPLADLRTYIHNKLLLLPSCVEWIRFWLNIQVPCVSDEILKILREEEQKQANNFKQRRACGTEDWMAPEIISKRNCGKNSYYFALSGDYHCKQCLPNIISSSSDADDLLPQMEDACSNCTDEIFEFYRKNDIYSMGLVIWSVLKAVLGSFSGYYTHDTNDICSYLDHPLDATTSNACGDNHNLAETSNLLLAEISKESRQNVIAKMEDSRIELIRQLAWKCLQPNPYERPKISDLYQEIERLERTLQKKENNQRRVYQSNSGDSSNRYSTVTTAIYTGNDTGP